MTNQLGFCKVILNLSSRYNWRASIASETLTGVKMKKSGMFIYLFVYMFGRTYVILYFDPRVFVLVTWSTLSQIALNRILWFSEKLNCLPF